MQRARVDVASILRRRIQWGLHLAQFKPGDRLPSLRAAAAEFGVDQRSVLAAYRALQEEGLVELRPRSGVYIAEVHAPPIDVPEERRWMVDVFLKGFSHGVAPSGLAAAITEVVGTRRLVAACVENNGDYLLAMSSQLRRDFGLDTIWVEPETLDAPHGTARLARADLIVTTSFFAHAARAAAREVGRPAVVVAADRDYTAQFRSALRRGPTYFVVVDPRYADRIRAAYRSARWLANLRALVVGQDAIESLPAGSSVFLTRAAAEVLGTTRVPRGATVMSHTMSPESRSALLGVLLAAGDEPDQAPCSSATAVSPSVAPTSCDLLCALADYASTGPEDVARRSDICSRIGRWVAERRGCPNAPSVSLREVVRDVVGALHQLSVAGLGAARWPSFEAEVVASVVEEYQRPAANSEQPAAS